MLRVLCESLLANVKLTDGCCGFVVNLPRLLESDVNAHDVHDVSFAVPTTLLELTSFSIKKKFPQQSSQQNKSLPISIANSGFSETVSNFLRNNCIVLNAYKIFNI